MICGIHYLDRIIEMCQKLHTLGNTPAFNSSFSILTKSTNGLPAPIGGN